MGGLIVGTIGLFFGLVLVGSSISSILNAASEKQDEEKPAKPVVKRGRKSVTKKEA